MKVQTSTAVFSPLFVISVYKLVRFYQPESRDEYSTTRATLTVFSPFLLPPRIIFLTSNIIPPFFSSAIVAFLLLFATFAVGLRCFADFDKGLLSSKLHGQSYSPVATGFSKADLFGDYFYFPSHIPLFSSAVTGSKTSYSSPLPSPGEHTNSSNMRQSSYNAGSQLGPRISIE